MEKKPILSTVKTWKSAQICSLLNFIRMIDDYRIISTFEMAKQSHVFFLEGELDFQHEIGLYHESSKFWKPIRQDKRNIIHKNQT